MEAVEIRFISYTQAAPEYDCSAYTTDEWTQRFGKPHPLLGYWSIAFALVCQIMLFLAIADLGGLTCVGTLFGYAMVRGYVFCSDPALGWTVGCCAYCFWSISTSTCSMLVLNRICEMTHRTRMFQGWLSLSYMAATVLYGVAGSLFTRPVFPNSAHTTLAFDPFIPGHTLDEYPNTANMMHNMSVAFGVPCLYILLCAVIRSDLSRFKSSSAVRAQAKVFTQASIICAVNAATAAAWLLQMFIPTPQIVVSAGMITIQCVHGLPCIIYLLLNRSVRDELRKMLGIREMPIGTASAMTRTEQMPKIV